MMDINKPDFFLRFVIRIVALVLYIPLGLVAQGLQSRRRPNPEHDNWVEINPIEIYLDRLDPAFDGYRIAHISDFHMGTWLTRDLLNDAIDLVNKHKPDLVAITGDFVTWIPDDYPRDLVEPLRNLSPKDASVAVLGNHDHWSDHVLVRKIILDSGIVDLSNAVHRVSRAGAELYIAGVDDYTNQQDDIKRVLAELPSGKACVLLAHAPDYADISAISGQIDLQLSGHSHGGQVILPVIGTPILPKHGRKYPRGLYQIKNLKLYTNRGLGTAELPIRWNCPPEITIITLRSPQESVRTVTSVN